MSAEWIFAEGVTDQSKEAVEALSHVDGIDGGKEFLEEISGAGELSQAGGGEFDSSTVALDDGTVGSRGQ